MKEMNKDIEWKKEKERGTQRKNNKREKNRVKIEQIIGINITKEKKNGEHDSDYRLATKEEIIDSSPYPHLFDKVYIEKRIKGVSQENRFLKIRLHIKKAEKQERKKNIADRLHFPFFFLLFLEENVTIV